MSNIQICSVPDTVTPPIFRGNMQLQQMSVTRFTKPDSQMAQEGEVEAAIRMRTAAMEMR